MEALQYSNSTMHLSGKLLNKNSIWNRKLLLPHSSWVAILMSVITQQASLLGRELNLLNDIKRDTETWLVLKHKLSSRSWFWEHVQTACTVLTVKIMPSVWQRKWPQRTVWWHSRNAKSQPEPVMEHLVGRQGQPREVQVHYMHLSDWKRWSQDPPLPRPHLRVGSGSKSISHWRSLPTWGLPWVSDSFISMSVVAVFGLVLICCSQRLCHPAVVILL